MHFQIIRNTIIIVIHISKILHKNYNLQTLMNTWDQLFTNIHEKHGSWENRKGYNRWTFKEIA